jgi:uncharacterized protein (TIRG00374 family)
MSSLNILIRWSVRFLPWLISIFCIYLITVWVPIKEVQDALKQIEFKWLVLAMFATSGNLLLRGLRGSLILHRANPQNISRITAISCLGLALNATLPGKVGEAARVVLLIRLVGVRAGHAVMSAIIERLMDLVILSSLAWYALTRIKLDNAEYGQELIAVSDFLMIISLTLLFLIFLTGFDHFGKKVRIWFAGKTIRFPKMRKIILRIMLDSRYVARHFMLTRVGPQSLCISAIMWLLLTASVASVAKALPGLDLSFGACLAIAALTTLASALPSAPGAWGVYEAVGMLVATQLVPEYEVTKIGAFILASHFAQFLPVLLMGLLSWILIRNTASVNSFINRNP